MLDKIKEQEEYIRNKERTQRIIFQCLSIIASLATFIAYVPVASSAFIHPENFDKRNVYFIYGIEIFTNLIWITYAIGTKSIALLVTSILILLVSTAILIQVVFLHKTYSSDYETMIKF